LSSRMSRTVLVTSGIAFVLAAGCSGIRTIDASGVRTMTVADLEALPESPDGNPFAAGEPVVVHVAAGEVLPLHLELSLPFLALEAGENRVRFARDVWLHISSDGMCISPDGQRWAMMGDFDAIKELFGFGQGSFQIGFGARAGEGAFVSAAVTVP
jgi:hypothetical protein